MTSKKKEKKVDQLKRFTDIGTDDNVAWEDVIAFNEQNLVHSRWELYFEDDTVEVERVATRTHGDINMGTSSQHGVGE